MSIHLGRVVYDPFGMDPNSGRVVRGGSFLDDPRECTSAYREISAIRRTTLSGGSRSVDKRHLPVASASAASPSARENSTDTAKEKE